MRGADAALAEIIRRRLENALGDRDRSSADAMSTRVRRLLVEHLGQAVLTRDAVATALAVSRRTLTRRLAEEGASFRHILDDVRNQFARALLQDRSLSIGDIAFFLPGPPNPRPSTDRSGGGPVRPRKRSERPDRSPYTAARVRSEMLRSMSIDSSRHWERNLASSVIATAQEFGNHRVTLRTRSANDADQLIRFGSTRVRYFSPSAG